MYIYAHYLWWQVCPPFFQYREVTFHTWDLFPSFRETERRVWCPSCSKVTLIQNNQYDILRHILRQTTLGSQQDVHVLVLESALQFAKNFNSCMWREKKDVWISNIILLGKEIGKKWIRKIWRYKIRNAFFPYFFAINFVSSKVYHCCLCF